MIILTTKRLSDKVEEAANSHYKDEEKDCSESKRMIQKTKITSSSGLQKPFLTKDDVQSG